MEQILDKLIELKDWLQGKKTYIMGICLMVTFITEHFGIIPPDIANSLKGIFGAGALITLRAGIRKNGNK